MVNELAVSYSQLIVYNKGIEKPFLDWTDADIQRGYTPLKILKADGLFTVKYDLKFITKQELKR
ncbi:competence protein ComJ [Fictibacillus solisalsi]|uniref:competence protein ComJ n=1 Tax=Fictibacillus solisalsi TaxID=459525 RepID=UPI0011139755